MTGLGIWRAGVIGTGRIASRFMPEAALVDGIRVQAAYNPHPQSAERFAARWGIEACEDLAGFFQAVDLVYVASPHETHGSYIKAALEQGKHVLCEKPLTLSGEQVKNLFAQAERQNLILFEGIKTAYCPGFRKMLEIARSGSIGTICGGLLYKAGIRGQQGADRQDLWRKLHRAWKLWPAAHREIIGKWI